MTEPVPLYRGLADYLNKLIDLSKSDKKLNAAIKELAKNMPVANGISKTKQLENATQCLEAAKDFASEHDKQTVFNKVIKKRKKAKSVDTNLEHACKDLLTALNIVHIAILGATQPESAKTDRTVLWVDDHPENNKDDVAKAKKDYHVSVVQKKSTEEAMDYVKSKVDKLKSAPSSQFRIVTDFYRDDEKEKAAESLIKSLRDDGWKCPVLIYCGEQSNVINLLAENSNVTVTTSDTLLYLYFETMGDAGKETKPEKEEKDELSEEHTEEMPKSEEEKPAKKKSDLKSSSKDLKKAGSNVSNKSTKSNKSAKAAEESEEEKEESTPPKKSVKKSSSNLSATSNKSAKSGTTAKAESEDEASEKEEKQDSPPPKKDVKKTNSNLSSTSNKSTKSNKIAKEESDEEKEPEPVKPTKEVKKTSSSLSNKSNKLVKEDSDEEKEEPKEVKKSTSSLSNKSKKEDDVKPAAKVAEKKDLKSSTGSASSKGSKLSESNEDKESKNNSPVVEPKVASKPELLKKTASGLSAGKGNKIGEDDESYDASPMSSPISAKKSSLLNPNLKKLTSSAEKKEKEPAKPVKLERDESASYTSRPEAVNSMLKLESDALAGRVCVLSVQVKDQFNTNFKEGGDFVAADFKGPAHFEGYVEDNNDGTYKISFFPTRTGSYKAYVTINGTDVKNSPFAFVAKEAPKNKPESKPQSPEPVPAAQKKRKLDEMEVDNQEEPVAKKSKIVPAATPSINKPTSAKAQEDAKLMPPPKVAASVSKKKEKSDEEKSDDDTYWLMDSDDSPKKQKNNLNSMVDSSMDKSVDAHNSSHEKGWDDEGGMEPTLRLDDDPFPIPPPRNVGQDDNEIEPTLKLDDDDWQIPKPNNMDIDENAPTQLLM
jgi:hypothetical protein